MEATNNTPAKFDPAALQHFALFNLVSLFLIVGIVNFLYFLPGIRRQVELFKASHVESVSKAGANASGTAVRYLTFRYQFARWLEQHYEYKREFKLAAFRNAVHQQAPLSRRAVYQSQFAGFDGGKCYFDCTKQSESDNQYCQSRCTF